MIKFRIIEVWLNGVLYYQLQEQTGFIFKRWIDAIHPHGLAEEGTVPSFDRVRTLAEAEKQLAWLQDPNRGHRYGKVVREYD